MITDSIDAKELFDALDNTWMEMIRLVSSVDGSIINKIPFDKSWTVAQLATHVTKSNNGMVYTLKEEGTTPERDPAAGVAKLKKIFLDFETKYQSPEFIIPEARDYDKEEVLNDLRKSIDQLKAQQKSANLSELLSVKIFGEVTKLELFYFILYHTQRHIHQLKNILKEL
jgi:hypothetical protein